MHYAAELKDQPEIVEVLIEKGANIDATNEDMKTPLFLAVQSSNYSAVSHLVRSNADYNLKDLTGQKAFDYIKDANEWVSSGCFNEDQLLILRSKLVLYNIKLCCFQSYYISINLI